MAHHKKAPLQCSAPINGHYSDSTTALKCPYHRAEARRALAMGLDLDTAINLAPPSLSDFGIHSAPIRSKSDRDPEIIRMALADPENVGGKTGLSRRTTDPEILHELALDKSARIRREVAGSPNIRSEDVEMMASDPQMDVRQIIAARDDVSKETLRKLAFEDPDQYVRQSALSNGIITADEIRQAFESELSLPERIGVAINPNTESDILHSLVTKKILSLSRTVASRPNASRDTQRAILRYFEDIGDPDLIRELARHPNLEEDVQEYLCNMIVGRVTDGTNKSSLYFDGALTSLLSSPNLDPRVIDRVLDICEDESTFISPGHVQAMAISPRMSNQALNRLSKMPPLYEQWRQDMLIKSETPQETIRRVIHGRIEVLTGMTSLTAGALDYLVEQGWTDLTPESPEVAIAETVYGRIES